jgi:hypothetical protein
MNTDSSPRLPQVTRWLVYAIMALAATVGIILALVAAVAPFYWGEAMVEIAKEHPGLDSATLLPWLLAVFAMVIMMLGLLWTILRKLLAILNSVEAGDPFVAANAIRLRAIGWLMIGAQLLGIPLAFAARNAANLFGENEVGYNFSLNGVLAILLVFILADIFQRGAAMREELEGTV